MAKITVVAATTGESGRPIVIDDKGRVWALGLNSEWVRIADLPDEPAGEAPRQSNINL